MADIALGRLRGLRGLCGARFPDIDGTEALSHGSASPGIARHGSMGAWDDGSVGQPWLGCHTHMFFLAVVGCRLSPAPAGRLDATASQRLPIVSRCLSVVSSHVPVLSSRRPRTAHPSRSRSRPPRPLLAFLALDVTLHRTPKSRAGTLNNQDGLLIARVL